MALLDIEPLGTTICGGNARDIPAISRYFSPKLLAQAVQYLARLPYGATAAAKIDMPVQEHDGISESKSQLASTT